MWSPSLGLSSCFHQNKDLTPEWNLVLWPSCHTTLVAHLCLHCFTVRASLYWIICSSRSQKASLGLFDHNSLCKISFPPGSFPDYLPPNVKQAFTCLLYSNNHLYQLQTLGSWGQGLYCSLLYILALSISNHSRHAKHLFLVNRQQKNIEMRTWLNRDKPYGG